MKKLYLSVFLFSFLFFSHRIDKVPQGLTIDEGAFGYNAALLSKTAKDENERILPFFILSINNKDWREPVPTYFMATFFKIFGVSITNLKLSSAVLASLSAMLIFYLTNTLLGTKAAFFSSFIFITSPVVYIHSHLGLDILTPIPMLLLWLIFLKSNPILSAFFLGVALYSYKAMRVFVPIFAVISLIYLFYNQKKKRKTVPFICTLAPFFLIMPYLEYKYAGAILGNQKPSFSIYSFFRSYFSTFDPSFLFVDGDSIVHHTTGKHGVFLLASLPAFMRGISFALKKGGFAKALVLAFFAGPLLIGFTGSYYRAGRIASLSAFYAVISAYGFNCFYKNQKAALFLLLALIAVNAGLFMNYYWYSYAEDTKNHFYDTKIEKTYSAMKDYLLKHDFVPYQTAEIVTGGDESAVRNFFRSIYFTQEINIYEGNPEALPKKSILLTRDSKLNLKRIDSQLSDYYLYIKE